MLEEASESKYAIGFFESWDLESLVAVMDAAEAKRSPAVIGFRGEALARPEDLEYYAALGKVAVDKSTVPVNLMLNEALNLDQVRKGIELGFSTVMMDFSSLPFSENVKLTKTIVEMAHRAGVCAEGQVSTLPIAEVGTSGHDTESQLTDPAVAAEYVKSTGVDAAGVSIGNVHSLRKGKPKIDLKRLKEIHDLTSVPLVMHGGSGFPRDVVGDVIRAGACKFNVATALRKAFLEGMKSVLDSETNPESIEWRGALQMQKAVEDLMELYGSAGVAE
jgi:ketose-bisphosphate aldolase